MSSGKSKSRNRVITQLLGCSALSLIGAAAGVSIGTMASTSASAASVVSDTIYGADLARVSDRELREMRGGVNVAGVDFTFGATVIVSSGSTVLATTVYTMNPNGSLSHTTTLGTGVTGVTPYNGSPGALLNGTGINVTGNGNSTGVVISSPTGTAVTLNTITANQMQALLANNAAGANVTQTVNGQLTINNFSQLNSAFASDISTMRALVAGTANPMLGH